MTGAATPSQIAGFLVALRLKGETVEEIAAAAQVMRDLAKPVVAGTDVIDIVGTGGDGAGTFNVSTACAFVVAAAGGRVAKHGNRSVSSHSGSADVLEALGIAIDLPPAAVARSIAETGFGFMFAPAYHSAMRHAVTPRRELGVRTIFNVLGPLTNPAGVRRLLIGVFDAAWVQPLAEVEKALGAEHVLVVHAEDGMDELSSNAPSRVTELRDGRLHSFTLEPARLGIEGGDAAALQVRNAEESRDSLLAVLDGRRGPAGEIVRLNAGAALYVAGLSDDIAAGIELADASIASGAAIEKIEQIRQFKP